MIILFTGDWHIRSNNPVNRIGDYEEDIFTKLEFIFVTARKHKCSVIVQPGDFFDHRRVPMHLLDRCIEFFSNSTIPVLTIFGQHDLYHHKSKLDTALKIMETCGAVQLLSDIPVRIDNVHFYGASWNESIPKVEKRRNTSNILATHRMVINKNPLWPGQTDFISGSNLNKQCKHYEIVCCGDNHNRFIAGNVVNAGSLMRSTVGQIEHTPTIYIYDTKECKLKEIAIPVKPAKDVLKVDEFTERKEKNEKLSSFVELLESPNEEIGLDFEKNVELLQNKKELGLKKFEINLVHDFIASYYEKEEI